MTPWLINRGSQTGGVVQRGLFGGVCFRPFLIESGRKEGRFVGKAGGVKQRGSYRGGLFGGVCLATLGQSKVEVNTKVK